MRIAGSTVIGWDMGAALQIATALGVPSMAAAELLPAVEAVMVRQLGAKTKDDTEARFNR